MANTFCIAEMGSGGRCPSIPSKNKYWQILKRRIGIDAWEDQQCLYQSTVITVPRSHDQLC